MLQNPTLALAIDLIRRQSVTPEDAGCQDLLIERLQHIGFSITKLPFGETDNSDQIKQSSRVENFWAIRGEQGPTLCFAGHTDVVPTGPIDQWTYPPFEPEINNSGLLYGRGAADMKGSLAAMTIAVEKFIQDHPDHPGKIAFLITSDEEGPAKFGTVKVVEWLKNNESHIEYCIVGEPSSSHSVGDVVKNGRRGSLNAKLIVKGKQGHIAYPHLAKNPIHIIAPAINELNQEQWDQGNEFFPATSFQISNIHSGTGATNIIPGTIELLFNFRFSTEVTHQELKQRVEDILNKHQLDFTIDWMLSGEPFLTPKGPLLHAVTQGIMEETGKTPELSTAGGTSDGRFIAKLGTQVIELGPVNKTIHQIDECVSVQDLEILTKIYYNSMKHLLLNL